MKTHLALIPILFSTFVSLSQASASPALHHRSLNLIDDSFLAAPAPRSFINPKNAIIPFNQWNSNNGYCGEVSLIQSGMNQGQWMSQYNARLICGTGLSQSGPDGFCASHGGQSNYNAQFLIENPNPGDSPFASAGLCLQNARLSFDLYDYSSNPSGMTGYKRYLAWIKSETIAGNNVVIAILNHGGGDSQYDHEVTVTRIGTNHDVLDPTYYGDDVLYFDDHGSGGTPYTQGYTFDSMAKTRDGANTMGAGSYSILIPGVYPVYSGSGGNGIDDNPHPITAQNYGFAVTGPVDPQKVTLPVTLTIAGSTTNGSPNSSMGVNGFNFETPGPQGGDCTNKPPQYWMGLSLKATVSNLAPGTAYKLYRYEFSRISGVGAAAALIVPDSNFNAHANQATAVTPFVASSQTYTQTVQTTADKIVVFRCVRADAP